VRALNNIADGMELIEEARKISPGLKVLVFSAESKVAVIDKLFNQLEVDGFVRKGRNDSQELRLALANGTIQIFYTVSRILHTISMPVVFRQSVAIICI